MGDLGVFVDRQILGNSEQLNSLIRCRDVGEAMGHSVYFIFPVEIKKIGKMDALFIRSRTDPMNISFVASKMAELQGIPVIDDPNSILICSDKINMYYHLMNNRVRMPETVFVNRKQIEREFINGLFSELGSPLVLKEPSTSFSVRVERVFDADGFIKVAKRFIKLSDWLVAQRYIESRYDWRIGVLNGQFLYACKYIIPTETFKIQSSVNGHIVYCTVVSVPESDVPSHVISLALEAASAIGSGLYGVDIKDSDGKAYVIEVNDNPSLESGEDGYYPDLYNKVISYLFNHHQ